MNNRLSAVIAAALLALTTASGARAATYYVAPGGDDTEPGTQARPWGTLTKALGALQPGDTLWIRGGVYVERIKNIAIQPGTARAPIKVRAYPGERAVLRGLLRLARPSYWTIDGLNVTWDKATGQPREHMVKLGDGVGWTFKNAEVWGARSYAAILVYSTRPGEPKNWRIAHCRIHDTYPANKKNQDQLLYVNSGLSGSGGVIERNLIYNAPNGNGIKLGGPAADSGGAAGVTIRYNTIYNTKQSILVAWQSRGNHIYRNLLGGVGKVHGGVRGYQLTGPNNIARDNLGFDAKAILLNDPGYVGVQDGGGNLLVSEVAFDSATSSSLRPRQPTAQRYGRYAQEDAPPARQPKKASPARNWQGNQIR